jgi:hypothetical protein
MDFDCPKNRGFFLSFVIPEVPFLEVRVRSGMEGKKVVKEKSDG